MAKRRKQSRHEYDWRKPRYYRSDPIRQVKRITPDDIKTNIHGSLTETKATEWQPINEKTLEELKERGLLSPQQIKNAERRLGITHSQPKKSKSVKPNKAKDPNEELIKQIAAIDLLTPEGLAEFKKIVEQRPDAIDLVAKATKMRNKLLAG